MIINPYIVGGSLPAGIGWDPANVDSLVALSNSDFTATRTGSGDSGYSAGLATLALSTGKRFFEIVADSASYGPSMLIGFAQAGQPLNSYVGSDVNGWSWNGNSGLYYHNGGNPVSSPGFGFTTGDVIGFYFDLTAGDIWFSKNGVGNHGTIGVAGTRDFIGVTGTFFPAFSFTRNTAPAHQVTLRTSSSTVQYPVAGFTPWGDP